MSKREQKEIAHLLYRGLSQRVAGKLSRAGLGWPIAVRMASDEEILAIPGIKEADVEEIRQKIG